MALHDASVTTDRADQMMKLTDRGVLERAALSMRRTAPAILWVRLLFAGTPRGIRRDKLACRATARLVRIQLACGGDIIIDSPPSNPSWELSEWQEVATDKRMRS